MKITQTCPACQKPLNAEDEGAGFVVWCSYYGCPDSRANDGAEGKTIDKAVRWLTTIIEDK